MDNFVENYCVQITKMKSLILWKIGAINIRQYDDIMEPP